MQSFSKTKSKSGVGCLSVATLFLATACSNLGDSNVTMSGHDDADVQNVKQSKRVEYFCDNNQALSVEYYERALDRSHVNTGINLRYQNREFEMYRSYSASGAKYATEQGLNPEDGLMWWSTGEKGRLITMILDDSVTAEDYPIITTCKTKGSTAFRQ
jgi:membrane-bound inhibitor of C-type lysozyme